jgi:hypothetical protein
MKTERHKIESIGRGEEIAKAAEILMHAYSCVDIGYPGCVYMAICPYCCALVRLLERSYENSL